MLIKDIRIVLNAKNGKKKIDFLELLSQTSESLYIVVVAICVVMITVAYWRDVVVFNFIQVAGLYHRNKFPNLQLPNLIYERTYTLQKLQEVTIRFEPKSDTISRNIIHPILLKRFLQ